MGRIFDLSEWTVYSLVLAGFIVILIAEPVATFWRKHTWREDRGLFVRDHSSLRLWAKNAGRRSLYLLLILAAMLLIWQIL